MTESVLTNRIPNPTGFRHAIAGYLREDAKRASARGGGFQSRNHANVLEQTATLVEGLDDDDHALGSLFDAQVNSASGTSTRDQYHPGPRAAKVIGNAGFTPASPTPAELLAEVLRAAQADLIAAKNAQVNGVSDNAEKRVRGAIQGRAEQAIERAQAKAQRAEAKARTLQAENTALQNEIRFLKPFAPSTNGEAPPTAEPEPTSKPEPKPERVQRQKVEPNIYRSEQADGSHKFSVKVGSHPWTPAETVREARKEKARLKALDAGLDPETGTA